MTTKDNIFFPAATDEVLKSQVVGDTNPRFVINADGDLEFGSGAGATDVVLERTSAGVFEATTGKIVSSRPLVPLAASTTITAALHAGRTLLLTGTGSALTQTLPAATGTGNSYLFVVGAVNTSSHIITALSGDLLCGNIITNSVSDTPDLSQPWPADQSNDVIITLNGTTTGGQAIGDWVEVIDIATDKWLVRGVTTTSGTEATPFS